VAIPNDSVEVNEFSETEELTGKMAFQHLEDKFMHSVMENDKKTIEEGKLLNDAMSYGMGSFTPDLMFQQLTQNYSLAKQIYGESLIRLVTGFDGSYVGKNIKIPEFRKELQQKITEKIDDLKDRGILSKENTITNKGLELASLVLYFQELDKISATGYVGEKPNKKISTYGEKIDYKDFRKGSKYRDIAIKKSIRKAIRRNHKQIEAEDLQIVERESKGKAVIIYALDASGSMKGKKIDCCKKAGVALAYKAISNKDKVGLIVFGSDIKGEIPPTSDFSTLLKSITSVKATKETDFVKTFKKAVELFPSEQATKHLVLLTDALPTKGDSPEKNAIEEAAIAKSNEITISVVGINLDKKGRELAEKIVEIGEGRLYSVRNLDNIDKIVLDDYYSVV
tara:strand:- start:42 stop:1229 length:1188 start_codon:yes stop_codon:yes gene_type:complete